MSYYWSKKEEFSEKSKAFHEGQEVSFIYKKEIRSGKIEVLRVNSAVISVKGIKIPVEKTERTVINYAKLMPTYK
ncbi:hypothetical protein IW492_01160 [Enterococcus sp. BWB1-3]|uniref:hypothetical protein n=1 Tax=unclassified Enterococcus TaxID=2608891 RepID=UPI001920D422|nr:MULTISPECIES: hypothetical protein [unclassified Enterococcus]MBL1227838.1 hypothetical protein [Enterococcus sp. BWB1-3]MCB5953162.1 hypothetical protein [Enterococcus sp. BWT-B8]MCB5956190.1 hypothetical protein [Enterococcus sp. CWB-B31]